MRDSVLLFAVAMPLAVLGFLLLVMRFSRGEADDWLDSFRETTGVELDAEQARRLRRRVRRDHACQLLGAGVGLPAIFALPAHTSAAFPVAIIPWCGGLIGVTVNDLWRMRKAREQTRVAHARSVTVADYVSPVQTSVTRSLAPLSLVPACATPFLPFHDGGRWAEFAVLLAASAMTIGFLVACEATQRWVVAQPQLAATSEELLVEDALRAGTLRAITVVSAGLCVMTTAMGLSRMAERVPSHELAGALRAAPIIAVLFLVGLSILYRRDEYRFRERIWADHDRV